MAMRISSHPPMESSRELMMLELEAQSVKRAIRLSCAGGGKGREEEEGW